MVRAQVSTHRAYGAAINGSVSATAVACATPAWDFDARVATVSLMRDVGPVLDAPTLAQSAARGVEVPADGLVNYFQFREAWFAVSPGEGGAVGGTHVLTIHGQVLPRYPPFLQFLHI